MLKAFMANLAMVTVDIKEREGGQGLVEYALILVFISIISIAALTLLGTSLRGVFQTVTSSL